MSQRHRDDLAACSECHHSLSLFYDVWECAAGRLSWEEIPRLLPPWLLELLPTQTKVTPEEETSIKKLPPLAWSEGMS